jgi:hypothetical protein
MIARRIVRGWEFARRYGLQAEIERQRAARSGRLDPEGDCNHRRFRLAALYFLPFLWGWHMSNQFRLFVAAGLVACAILGIAVGLASNAAALAAPAHLILFIAAIGFYLLPTALALHRNCKATGWILALNVLLGWTLFGWVIALGWAASGKTWTTPRSTPPPPVRPVPGH